MCGICGIVDRKGVELNPALLSRMNARLLHRGPDEGGEWIDGPVGLAMRRLAIIDLTSGQQPIFNEDGSIAIVFNGEIYNYLELYGPLEAAGHKFKTHSDTEVIVHAYEQYGTDCLAMLNGMFAIALWDNRRQELMLARDRVGKKPVYYALVDGRIVFSSELVSLLEHPGISREVDSAALDAYFALGYVPPPMTIFRQVRQLDPGHCLIWKDGRIETRRYWRLAPYSSVPRTENEAAEELLTLLRDATRIRLRSDVPFGALLSGGVDSGLIVGLMSKLMDRPVQTFTMGFDDKSIDESEQAAAIAKYFGAEHHHMTALPHDAIELAEKMIAHFGEPFADDSAIPTYLVSELARRSVTVALTGDGGDEVFGGYNAYRYHATAEAWRGAPAGFRALVRNATRAVNGNAGSVGSRVRRFVAEAELPVDVAWRNSRGIFNDSELRDLYTPEFAATLNEGNRNARMKESFVHFRAGGSDASILNYVDYETYLPGDILVKVDRMSMANSIELRAPLLDYRIAEFSATLPREWKWDRNTGKRILKRAARSVLPESALNRRKQGFDSPIRSWLRGDLRAFAKELIERSRAGNVIRLDYARELLERHGRGEGGALERKLWSIICYLLWHEKFAA